LDSPVARVAMVPVSQSSRQGIVAGDFIGGLVEIKYGRSHDGLSKASFLPNSP
jgi:hypothetical protein